MRDRIVFRIIFAAFMTAANLIFGGMLSFFLTLPLLWLAPNHNHDAVWAELTYVSVAFVGALYAIHFYEKVHPVDRTEVSRLHGGAHER